MGLIKWIRDRRTKRRRRDEERERQARIDECLAVEDPHVYAMGGYWGCHISWRDKDDWENGRVYGHQPRRPEFGDVVEIGTEGGRMMIARFLEVEYCRDPPDMFFGTLHFVGHKEQGDQFVTCAKCKKTWVAEHWSQESCPGCAFNRVMGRVA